VTKESIQWERECEGSDKDVDVVMMGGGGKEMKRDKCVLDLTLLTQ
jgi:hypothetical protein